MKILISADGTTIRMKKTRWSMSCPAAELPRWIATYTKMRDRAHGRFSAFYAQDVADMQAAQTRLDAAKARI